MVYEEMILIVVQNVWQLLLFSIYSALQNDFEICATNSRDTDWCGRM